MAKTNDERRKVAERMRGVSEKEYSLMFLDELLDGLLGGCRDSECQISNRKIMLRLADLIDPICEMVEDNNHWASDFDYVCRACGEHFSTCDGPNYCPYCAARVVQR